MQQFNRLLTAIKLIKWKGYVWLPNYLNQRIQDNHIHDSATDLIVIVVDHFEPSRREGIKGIERVRNWCEKYEEIAGKHFDNDGVHPQHTWFYRYDYPSVECVQILTESVYRGFGEIEFHLHHGHDTPESFTEKINRGVKWFNEMGAMISAENNPQKRFAYIAGNWALDNGRRDPSMSGVNTELSILRKAGCYADFTFPAFGTNAQPKKINTIYYATDTPLPKSYNTGVDVEVGKDARGDLMIVQGPLYVCWQKMYIEYAALESFSPYVSDRIQYWLQPHIHVKGRPEWVFVKLHTHGMQSHKVFLSDQLHMLFSGLKDECDRKNIRLHYVTAREGYNIIKAAEAGMIGNPFNYRDFLIPMPVNRNVFCNQPYTFASYCDNHVSVNINGNGQETVFYSHDLPLRYISGGNIKRIDLFYRSDAVKKLKIKGEGMCQIKYKLYERGELKEINNHVLLPIDLDLSHN